MNDQNKSECMNCGAVPGDKFHCEWSKCAALNEPTAPVLAAAGVMQPVDERALPPLPKVGPICYAMVADIQQYKVPRVGKHLPGVFDAALWSTDQLHAYARAALSAGPTQAADATDDRPCCFDGDCDECRDKAAEQTATTASAKFSGDK